MLKQVYVIDFIVRDLEQAVDYFRKVLGTEPVETSGVGDDVDEFRMAHFPAPGARKDSMHAIGLFQLTTDNPVTPSGKRAKDYLDTRGEGPILVGFGVDDIDATEREMKAQGLSFEEPEPVRYQMGRGLNMPIRFGTGFWFAQHDSDGFEKWQAMGNKQESKK